MSNVSELLEKAERLVALLKDPHPGLFTWQQAVSNTRESIAAHPSPERELTDESSAFYSPEWREIADEIGREKG